MKVLKVALFAGVFSTSLCAAPVEIVGKLNRKIDPPGKSIGVSPKQITLMKLKFDNQALESIKKRSNKSLSSLKSLSTSYSTLPAKVQLGMNGVPVLDQGPYGTCVTFATTAAFDAAVYGKDYISQLCQLELGTYLEENSFSTSGWEGSWGPEVINQMIHYGVVSKDYQKEEGCAGLHKYPSSSLIPSASLSLTEYASISEELSPYDVSWSPILDVNTAVLDRTDTSKTLVEVKKALKAGDRVTFGVILTAFDMGFMGAVGSHNAKHDSWVLTPEIARNAYLSMELGGHEMVITGYDDNAVSYDESGKAHRGLLTLRNSWSEYVGDAGDFYMSYDYFVMFVIEAQRIRRFDPWF